MRIAVVCQWRIRHWYSLHSVWEPINPGRSPNLLLWRYDSSVTLGIAVPERDLNPLRDDDNLHNGLTQSLEGTPTHIQVTSIQPRSLLRTFRPWWGPRDALSWLCQNDTVPEKDLNILKPWYSP